MKVGDLVTVLPHGQDVYLIIDFLRQADTEEAQRELGSLWLLYSEERVGKMHEKYIKAL